MTALRNLAVRTLLALSVLTGLASAALAADYPTHPIKIISPNPAASVATVLLRSISAVAGPALGTSFVIENKVGGNTFIGMIAGVNATPDGYTLLQTNSATDAIHPILYNKLPYDASGLMPLAILGSTPYVLVVPAQFPAKTVAELVQLVKSRPGTYNYGSSGVGTGIHLMIEKFAKESGLKMEPVQFPGSSAAHLSMIRGETHVMFDVLTSALPRIQDGRLRALAVGTETRFPGLPDVPTMVESGYKGYDMMAWYALQAPKGTPAVAIDALSDAINKALADQQIREQYAKMGMLLGKPGKPQNMTERIAIDRALWSPIVKSLNLSLDIN